MIENVSNVQLFRSLPANEFARLARILHKREVPSNTLLCREGDVGEEVYFVIEGELEIIKSLGTADENLIAVHRSGNIVGEMSLLMPNQQRTASVRARGDVELFVLNLEEFHELLKKSPIIGYRILQELGIRLHDTNTELQDKNQELSQAYEDLKAAQAEIIQKEKLEHELEVARQIQQNILPQEIIQLPGCDFGARMEPARAVGGDFYDLIPINECQMGVAIGDVSDKGVPAAMFMAQFCTLLRVLVENDLSPVEVLRQINDHLLEKNQAGMFVTAIYGVFDCRDRTFTYARAGHEVPVVFDAQGKAIKISYDQGAPLCVFPDPPIDEQKIRIPEKGTLMLYTDGGTDALSAEEDFFGLDNLQKTVSALLEEPAQVLCDQVVDKLLAYQGGDAQFDDITLVAMRLC